MEITTINIIPFLCHGDEIRISTISKEVGLPGLEFYAVVDRRAPLNRYEHKQTDTVIQVKKVLGKANKTCTHCKHTAPQDTRVKELES